MFVVVGSCNAGSDDASSAAPARTPTTTSAAPVAPANPCPYTSSAQPAAYDGMRGCYAGGELVTISRIHDAATYVLSDGRTIRLAGVLAQGITTCAGKQALQLVNGIVAVGQQVNLVRDPGAGTDPFGSQWAYLQAGYAQDVGSTLATAGYADLYAESGANASYLQAIAPAIRMAQQLHTGQFGPPCGPALERPQPLVTNDSNRTYLRNQDNEPDPPKRRTGRSGHPCLPGERDGDGDGYCKEGR
ncbi:hypothetical protein BKA01_003342 [Pseudonocardia eucalypti]|uniref:hypothetical protein n=1 Tax=Pseudonocardia eucalypti TaxID=648755 RepID=UPI00160E5B62|nr:hypothetical protein [Pseudonocardia eucalypti]